MFTHICTRCGSRQRFSLGVAGTRVQCPGCRQTIPLPSQRTIEEETLDYLGIVRDGTRSVKGAARLELCLGR
jgi:hypothetical protein